MLLVINNPSWIRTSIDRYLKMNRLEIIGRKTAEYQQIFGWINSFSTIQIRGFFIFWKNYLFVWLYVRQTNNFNLPTQSPPKHHHNTTNTPLIFFTNWQFFDLVKLGFYLSPAGGACPDFSGGNTSNINSFQMGVELNNFVPICSFLIPFVPDRFQLLPGHL